MAARVRRASLPGPDIGYAYEAAAAVMEHAAHVLRIATVCGLTAPHNPASINLLNKLGLRYARFSRRSPDGKHTPIYRKDFRGEGSAQAS